MGFEELKEGLSEFMSKHGAMLVFAVIFLIVVFGVYSMFFAPKPSILFTVKALDVGTPLDSIELKLTSPVEKTLFPDLNGNAVFDKLPRAMISYTASDASGKYAPVSGSIDLSQQGSQVFEKIEGIKESKLGHAKLRKRMNQDFFDFEISARWQL